MKILMLAWRDMKHPLKGGAEVVTDIYLKGLASKGHKVTLFSAHVKGLPENETYHGYEIIRRGKRFSVHIKGLIYAKKNQDKYDIIIDQVNTIPFFTPLLIKREKRIAFFHQLCLNVWFYETKFPISIIGYLSERLYLNFYNNTKSFVVSNSTKNDLIKYCHAKDKNILILENQIDFPIIKKKTKKKKQFVFCARLVKSKRANDAISALSMTKDKNAKLIIIGDGPEMPNLKRLVKEKGLKKRVEFTGKLNFDERNKIMSESLAIVVTSVREGWGLIVTEANANMTPAITYDIQGLRDANRAGIIVKHNNPKEIAKEMDHIISDPKLSEDLNSSSIEFAKSHRDWQSNIDRLEQWLAKH